MYAPRSPKPPARPMILPTRITTKQLAEKRANIRRLQGYQFGAYDNSSEAVAFDQQQDFFSGLEAERGKKRTAETAMWTKRGRRRGTRYAFFDGMDNDEPALDMQQDQFGLAPFAIAAGAKTAGVKLSLKKSSTPGSNQASLAASEGVRAGDANALNFLIVQGGYTSNGGWRGAVGKGADYYARGLLAQLLADGVIVGPPVDVNNWKTPHNWRLAPKSGVPAGYIPPTPTQPIGILAPGGGVNPIPPATPPAAPPSMAVPPTFAPPDAQATLEPASDGAPSEMPTESQKPREAGLFAGLANLGPTGMLMLAGSGLFLIAQAMPKGRRRSRRR